jgi:hypothetical protein
VWIETKAGVSSMSRGECWVLNFWIVRALNGYATKGYPKISALVICYEWYAAWFGLGLRTWFRIIF